MKYGKLRVVRKPTFEQWRQRVDESVDARCGLSIDDLPDQPYRQWYDDGVSPASAANRAVRQASD